MPAGVVMHGPVRHLSAVFESVRLTVAPPQREAASVPCLWAGLAAGIPCVSTSHIERLLAVGEPDAMAMMADTAPALAERICRLHRDEAENARRAVAGLRLATTMSRRDAA